MFPLPLSDHSSFSPLKSKTSFAWSTCDETACPLHGAVSSLFAVPPPSFPAQRARHTYHSNTLPRDPQTQGPSLPIRPTGKLLTQVKPSSVHSHHTCSVALPCKFITASLKLAFPGQCTCPSLSVHSPSPSSSSVFHTSFPTSESADDLGPWCMYHL